MELAHGGHLTHGMKLNVSGKLYNVASYQVRKDDYRVDMEQVERQAKEHRPKVIVAGWSAYPRHLDFAEFRRIADEVGAKLFVDMAHFAGLVAAGEHPSPVPHADVVTTTTHKTLGGPRAGLILCKEEYAQAIDKAVFPGQQGGPAGAHHRGQGRVPADRRQRHLPRPSAADDRQRKGVRRDASGGRPRRAHRRHRRAPRARRPRHGRPQRPRGRGPPRRGRHHRQPQRDPVRPAPADAGLRPADRHAGADHARDGRGRHARDRPGDLRRARHRTTTTRAARSSAERTKALVERYPLYPSLSAATV